MQVQKKYMGKKKYKGKKMYTGKRIHRYKMRLHKRDLED